MTVGDLSASGGDLSSAGDFERLAQIYPADGFLPKPSPSTRSRQAGAGNPPVERRPTCTCSRVRRGPDDLRTGRGAPERHRPAQAVGVLRKLMDAEPENLRVRRAAEISLAWAIRQSGAHACGGRALQRREDTPRSKYAESPLKLTRGDAPHGERARAWRRRKANDAVACEALPKLEAAARLAGCS